MLHERRFNADSHCKSQYTKTRACHLFMQLLLHYKSAKLLPSHMALTITGGLGLKLYPIRVFTYDNREMLKQDVS